MKGAGPQTTGHGPELPGHLPKGADPFADRFVKRMAANAPEVRIATQPFEIAITQVEGLMEGCDRPGWLTGEGQAAGKIVAAHCIARPQFHQPLIHGQPPLIPPATRVVVPQYLQRFNESWIAPDHAFQKTDLDIQILGLTPRQTPIRIRFLRHELHAPRVLQMPSCCQGRGTSRIRLHPAPRRVYGIPVRCVVTGASGFIGSNLVHLLVERGHQVRALVRRESNRGGLAGTECEVVAGDITDPHWLAPILAGCDWCFHVAASYHLWLRDYAPMIRANVDGTRNVLEAAGRAGCSRIVYTSTVGCVGLPRTVHGGLPTPADETSPVAETQMTNPYKHSKWRAERIALELAGRGLPVVIVNPSAPVGPGDVKPTPTGQFILDFLNRRMPGYVDTGLNWVHVRDVAVGHLLAAERGRIGERYILGHTEGNWTMKHTLDVLAELTGLPAPRMRVPYAVAYTAACLNEALARVTGRPPKAPLAGVRMAKYMMWFNPAKAIRELGLPQTPPQQAFRDAVAWFRRTGVAPPQ